MSNEKIPCKIYLSENEFPDSWYNVRADMKNRLRRLRVSENIRSLVRETSGVKAVLLFGIPAVKDEFRREAYNNNGIVQCAIRQIKQNHAEMIVIADVCLCEYTSHGHCGLIKNGLILNDASLPLLAKMSVSSAKAGADIIAPNDMRDGRVGFIRNALDENGFENVSIMAYSAKFASMQSVSYKNGQYIITSRFTMPKDMISTLVSLEESDINDLDYAEDLEDYVDAFENILGDSMTSKSPKLRQEINELYKSLRDSNMFPAGGYTSKVDTNADVEIHYEA